MKILWMMHKKKIITVASIIVIAAILTPFIIFFTPTTAEEAQEVLGTGALDVEDFADWQLTDMQAFALGLTLDDFINDLEYLQIFLHENFPYIYMTQRQYDFYLLQTLDELIQRIETYGEEHGYGFWEFYDIIWQDIFQVINHMGGLNVLVPQITYHQFINTFINYLEIHPSNSSKHQLASHYIQLLEQSRIIIDLTAPNTRLLEIFFTDPPHLLTYDIIEDGTIAYLNIPQLPQVVLEHHRTALYEFYEQIQGFEHLIIDIRGNYAVDGLRGNELGHFSFFSEFLAPPLINQPLSTYTLAFHKDGQYVSDIFNIARSQNNAYSLALSQPIASTVNAITPSGQFSNYIAQDLENLDYFFVEHITVYPSEDGRIFEGKIWLLIDEMTVENAARVANFARDTGFATLVGERSGGFVSLQDYGTSFLMLPNTELIIRFSPAYITNRYGEALELGVVPHHFNRQDMDALATTLALIADGAY